MTVSSTTSRNDYVGNGATSSYAYSFRIFANTDLVVTVRDTNSVETTLALTTDYTVSGVGNGSGGNVVLVNASQSWLLGGFLRSGFALSIQRRLPLTQATDIRNQGDFYPETHEDQFDRLVMISQQQQDSLNRSVQLGDSYNPSGYSLELTPAQNTFLGWDSAGTALRTYVIGSGTGILTNSIVNADINESAAIARSKLANGTANHVVINNASGVMSSEAAISPTRGGTGVSNNVAATLTRSGDHALTITTTATTSVTLPTSGTLATTALATGVAAGLLNYYATTTITADNNFTGGTIKLVRVGDAVTMMTTANLTHASASSATSSAGLIPAAYRPPQDVSGVYSAVGSQVRNFSVTAAGTFTASYFDYAGAASNRTSTGTFSMSWTV